MSMVHSASASRHFEGLKLEVRLLARRIGQSLAGNRAFRIERADGADRGVGAYEPEFLSSREAGRAAVVSALPLPLNPAGSGESEAGDGHEVTCFRVTLMGSVHSPLERRDIVESLSSIPGVAQIKDRLEVDL